MLPAVLRINLLTLAYEFKVENKALKERLLPSWSFSSNRVSKEFMDAQRLASHAFMSHKFRLRAEHSPYKEAMAQKEDVILWRSSSFITVLWKKIKWMSRKSSNPLRKNDITPSFSKEFDDLLSIDQEDYPLYPTWIDFDGLGRKRLFKLPVYPWYVRGIHKRFLLTLKRNSSTILNLAEK
ncbi:hypothetical protein RHMOL_Rhmol03G0088100 [Rhododendron molle]|uniref:Uncharacterized protein n=1 Tax=Rhododendron molle TaxID=49168 RepID=A0ACC0PEL3_RHOML|nr:hypothetical protein RHMOL_Rhmol03G0088100 [Rhododendron molle]